MKLSDKQIAARLVRVDAPKLSTQDVAEYLDVKPVTLRSWITREYIKPFDAERGSSGRGKSSLFSPLDVAQLFICAKMTRFSIVPGFLTAKFSAEVTTHVLGHLHVIAETEGYEEEQRKIIADFHDKTIADARQRGMPESSLEILEAQKQESLGQEIAPRYYSITYSDLGKMFLSVTFEREMIKSGGHFLDPVHLVFDCLDIAKKLIRAYRAYGNM